MWKIQISIGAQSDPRSHQLHNGYASAQALSQDLQARGQGLTPSANCIV